MDRNGNGKPPEGEILFIGRKGLKWFALSRETEPVQLDVILVNNAWIDLHRSFCNDKGVVPAEQVEQLNQATLQFAMSALGADDVNLAEALHFINLLGQEAKKLAVFFGDESSDEPSSRESTELTFST